MPIAVDLIFLFLQVMLFFTFLYFAYIYKDDETVDCIAGSTSKVKFELDSDQVG